MSFDEIPLLRKDTTLQVSIFEMIGPSFWKDSDRAVGGLTDTHSANARRTSRRRYENLSHHILQGRNNRLFQQGMRLRAGRPGLGWRSASGEGRNTYKYCKQN